MYMRMNACMYVHATITIYDAYTKHRETFRLGYKRAFIDIAIYIDVISVQ